MSINATQIKITLPDPLYDYISSRADKFGLTLSSYVKNLILNDVKDMEYPTYQASPKVEAAYRQALEEKDRATEVKNIKTFFSKL